MKKEIEAGESNETGKNMNESLEKKGMEKEHE